jgi:dihydrodipicolinate reductase
MSKLRVAVAGASGRMGKMLIEAILASDDIELAGALDVASWLPSAPMQVCLRVKPPACRLHLIWQPV